VIQECAPITLIESPHTAAFTLRGAFTSAGRTVPHLQYLTGRYTVTEFESSVVLHAPSLGGRFVVDRPRGLLRRIDDSAQRAQLDHIRAVLGVFHVDRSTNQCDIDGFRCRLYTVRNENGRIMIDAEAWCTRVEGAEATALQSGRLYDAELHPFTLPLEADEIVVRSLMRTMANGDEQRQSYQLLGLLPRIDDRPTVDDLLTLPIAGE
jgi:hypothetical protein